MIKQPGFRNGSLVVALAEAPPERRLCIYILIHKSKIQTTHAACYPVSHALPRRRHSGQ